MAYKTGTVANSYELVHIIHAMLRDVGWRLVSSLASDESADDVGTNSVFYSSGEDGEQDIYIRVAANQRDKSSVGDIQFPYSDGYNGYVNVFAYQYFPDGGSLEDGCNEVGVDGPALRYIDDNAYLYEYSFGYYDDGYAAGRRTRRYQALNDGHYGRWDGEITDGHRFNYRNSNSNGYLSRTDMAQYPLNDYNRASLFGSAADRGACWSRKGPREPMVWIAVNGYYYTNDDNYGGWSTYNQLTNGYSSASTSYTTPPWDGSGNSEGWCIQGVRRNRSRYLYVARGYSTGQWARYDMENNEWSGYLTNVGVGVRDGNSAVYVMKENTGYEYDRIYQTTGNTSKYFASIAIDDNGDPVGSWIFHAQLPVNSAEWGDSIYYLGGDRIFMAYVGSRTLYQWKFPEVATDVGPSWEQVGDGTFYAGTPTGNPTWHTQNHLCSRVGVDENDITEYWVFCDKDRLIIVTNNYESSYSSDYDVTYAGLFESQYDTTKVIITEEILEGATRIKVSDTSMFKIDEKYQIVKIGEGILYETLSGELKRLAYSDYVKVVAVYQSTSEIEIETALENPYPVGTKIGKDVQPVGVLRIHKDEFQVLSNHALSGKMTSSNPVFQMYRLDEIVSATQTNSERVEGATVYPVYIKTDGITNESEPEVRGKLKGIYKSGGTVLNESEAYIGDKKYIGFGPANSYRFGRFLIGPME